MLASLLLLVLFVFISAETLFLTVRAINPNPETNPTFQDALYYSVVGMVLGRVPFGGYLHIFFWVWVFNQKFYLNFLALILCTIVQYAVLFAFFFALGMLS